MCKKTTYSQLIQPWESKNSTHKRNALIHSWGAAAQLPKHFPPTRFQLLVLIIDEVSLNMSCDGDKP
jgi:hypothetical protein